jgi:hypothetical protein
MPFRARAGAAAALAATAWLLACGGSERSGREPADAGEAADSGEPADAGEAEALAAGLASIEALPEDLRRELLRTCDKWRHLDHACDDESVRRKVLECWAAKGEPIYAWTGTRGVRPRTRYQRTLTEVNLCMELARWRKIAPGPELTTREE